jgi:hypothetical protein
MGWEGREWAKWSDEERAAYLEGRAPRQRVTGSQLVERLDSPYSAGISLRVKVWGGLGAAVALLVACLVYLAATVPTDRAAGSSIWRPVVLYGWEHVPPVGSGNIDPSRVETTLAGKPILCTSRRPDERRRWVCTTYTYVYGRRVVVLPPNSPLQYVACNTDPNAPCPGNTV